MKKKTLSIRAAVIGVSFMLVGIASILVRVAFLWNGKQEPGMQIFLPVLESAAYIMIAVAAVKYVVQPYQEIQRVYKRFAEGQAYEELFNIECELMPQWNEVMEKLRYFLSKQDAIRMSKKQAEYLALQNQINPHFLYNTLEAIRGDAICAGMQSIAETTEALSIFFRYSITGVDKLVTLEEEIDNVENYFTIQHYRFGEKLQLKIQCPKEEEVFRMKLPKLTIQPFVENAIYHGLEKKVQGGTVKVKIDTTEKKLLIIVSDDGVGMAEEQAEQINSYLEKVAVSYVGDERRRRGGIAMKNVNSRIKLLFGEMYGIQVYSEENIGTDVKIILPKIGAGVYEEGTAEN